MVFQGAGVGRAVHAEQARASLPMDLAMEYQRVADVVTALALEHSSELAVDVVDPASLAGFWLSLRHRLRHYPAVLFNGQPVEPGRLREVVEARLASETGT
jgi:hypothetical protein